MLVFRGKKYKSAMAFCKAIGLRYNTYLSRKYVKHWDLEQIVTTPVLKMTRPNIKNSHVRIPE
jgi:hypothetical protein